MFPRPLWPAFLVLPGLLCHTRAAAQAGYVPVAPCRLFDTRDSVGADSAAPILVPASARTFHAVGRCGVPGSARALSVNVTLTQPSAAGYLTLYRTDLGSAPATSTIDFAAGSTRANNAILELSRDGAGAFDVLNGSSGTTHFVLDVSGYFGTPGGPELWVFWRTSLDTVGNLDAFKDTMARAALDGYKGVLLSDWSLEILASPRLSATSKANLQTAWAYAESLGLEVVPDIFPFGYSDAVLFFDPNLAEGQPVNGAPFLAGTGSLTFQGAALPLANGNFETHTADTFTSWLYQDEPGVRTFADTTVFHGGTCSLRIGPGNGNARMIANLAVLPHRQYHVRCYVKTSNYQASWTQVMLVDAGTNQTLSFGNSGILATQDWTPLDVVVNSRTATSVNLLMGSWTSSTGTMWIDDVSIEEVALVNLVERAGAPLTLRRASDGFVFVEGTDFDRPADSLGVQGGYRNAYHAPPTVTLPAGSRIAPGTAVTIDYYAVAPVLASAVYAGYMQVGACLSEPGVQSYMTQDVQAIQALFPQVKRVLVNDDEMRHMNTCALCAGKGMTAGQLLAWHLGSAEQTIHASFRSAEVWVWNDMFDPQQNAVPSYYYDGGSLANSWSGPGTSTVMVNWNHAHLATSLAFFSNQGHTQLIAGYFDSGDGTTSGTNESHAATGVANVRGSIYVTWKGDYTQLDQYAAAVRAGWGK